MDKKTIKTTNYTCTEYREEMILLGLQRKLADNNLTKEERQSLLEEITKVEEQMGL
jgi:hypothetical protein